ncbi:MAG: hypothetical protein AAFR61_15270 [Bacteroidota bacterium]
MKIIAQVWGLAFLIIALGTFINSFHPDFSLLHPLETMTPGNWFIFAGTAFAIFALPLNALRKQKAQQSSYTRSNSQKEVIPIISRLAAWPNLWVVLAVAIILFVGPTWLPAWAAPIEALGGVSLVLTSGLFMWRIFFLRDGAGN